MPKLWQLIRRSARISWVQEWITNLQGKQIMKKILLMGTLASFFVGGAVPIASADSTTDALIGNTLRATSTVDSYNVYYNGDGSYSTSKGEKGKWAVAEGEMCHSPEGGEKNCVPHNPDRKLGEKWTVTDLNDVKWTIGIVEGRPE